MAKPGTDEDFGAAQARMPVPQTESLWHSAGGAEAWEIASDKALRRAVGRRIYSSTGQPVLLCGQVLGM